MLFFLNCGNASVAFGYAISKNEEDNIVACSGRVQPRACYVINIEFKPMGMNTTEKGYLLGGLPVLAIVGFIFVGAVKPQKASPNDKDTKVFTLGSVLFDAQERRLIINKNTIDLNGTETRLLLIFALSPNQTIERRLQYNTGVNYCQISDITFNILYFLLK